MLMKIIAKIKKLAFQRHNYDPINYANNDYKYELERLGKIYLLWRFC
jgi:hypothetical protein